MRAGVGALCVDSRLERCFFETVFFLGAVEADEDEAGCCWDANAGADGTRRAAASARHLIGFFIEMAPALLSRNLIAAQGAA